VVVAAVARFVVAAAEEATTSTTSNLKEEEEAEARGKARQKTRPDMTRAPAATPAPTPSTEVDVSLTQLISENLQMQEKDGVPCQSVRAHVAEWQRAGASNTILKIIKGGLTAALTGQPKLLRYVPSNVPDSVLHEQVEMGAARYLTKTEEQKTQHWTPVFLRPKPNGKARLITDCRRLNRTATAPKFKQNVISELQQALYGAKGWYGAIVDYKRAFHHVQVDPALGRWMRIRGQATAIQLEAMPFGYGPSPYWWFKLYAYLWGCGGRPAWCWSCTWTTSSS
jgi:hypothetical protein